MITYIQLSQLHIHPCAFCSPKIQWSLPLAGAFLFPILSIPVCLIHTYTHVYVYMCVYIIVLVEFGRETTIWCINLMYKFIRTLKIQTQRDIHTEISSTYILETFHTFSHRRKPKLLLFRTSNFTRNWGTSPKTKTNQNKEFKKRIEGF